MLIDSHVNLHATAFDADRAEVIARARAAGVGLMINICDRLSNLAAVRAVGEGLATSGIRWARIRTRRGRTPIYNRET